jgi:hypothetical protein
MGFEKAIGGCIMQQHELGEFFLTNNVASIAFASMIEVGSCSRM